MTDELAVEIEKAFVGNYQAQAAADGIMLDTYELKRFDGGIAIATVVVPLVSATLPFVTRMVIAEIQARRHVKVKYRGVEIRGLSADDAEKILGRVLASK